MSDMRTLAKRLAEACSENYRFFMAPEYGPEDWGITDIRNEDVVWDNASQDHWEDFWGEVAKQVPGLIGLLRRPLPNEEALSAAHTLSLAEQIVQHFEASAKGRE